MTAENVFPKSSGDQIYASELNSFNTQAFVIDTAGTLSTTGSSANHEYAISFSGVTPPTNVTVQVSGLSAIGNVNNDCHLAIKIERKDTGGSYSTAYDHTVFKYQFSGDMTGPTDVSFPLVLTAGEKSAGLTVKITTTAAAGAGSSHAYTNTAVIIRRL